MYATSLDKVPVTEEASQKLPKLIPLGFNVELISITGPPAQGLDKVIWNAALRGHGGSPNAKAVA